MILLLLDSRVVQPIVNDIVQLENIAFPSPSALSSQYCPTGCVSTAHHYADILSRNITKDLTLEAYSDSLRRKVLLNNIYVIR